MDEPAAGRPAPIRPHGALLAALLVLLAVIAIPVTAALLHDDDSHGRKIHTDADTDGTQQVLDALAATVSSGSYDLEFTFHGEPASPPASCTRVQQQSPVEFASGTAQCLGNASTYAVSVTGSGTVNTAPYAMKVDTDVSSLGPVTVYVNGTSVYEIGGAGYGTNPADAPSGRSLSGFAFLVEGTLGQGQGALTMISLANNSGYLGLESDAIVSATTDGDGALADGTHVKYYEADVDITKMASSAALTDEQRQAITDAVAVLQSAGYTDSKERIGIDDAGFIREVTATTTFTDGSTMIRHSHFSNFGCASHVTMPNEPPDSTPTGPCAAATTTTTMPAPTSTSAAPTSTSAAPTSTSAAPTSTAPGPTRTVVPTTTVPVPATSAPGPTTTSNG